MQMSATRSRRKQGDNDHKGNRSLGRAFRYIGRYPKVALVAIVALLVATAAQLAVPQLVQNILDTITGSAVNRFILDLPAEVQQIAAQQLGLDLAAMQADGVVIEACIACANMYGIADNLKELGFDVKGMGRPLTEYLKSGVKVLTF